MLVAAVAVMCAIWGSTWIVIKAGAVVLPPFTGAAWRMVVAWVVMVVVCVPLARREGRPRPPWRLVVATGLLQFTISYAIVYQCAVVLPSGLTAVLWAIYPMLLGVVSLLFAPSQRLAGRQWLGLTLGFGGIVGLFATDLEAAGPQHLTAAAVLLLSPLVVAFSNVYLKQRGSGYSVTLLNRDALAIGSFGLLALATATEQPFGIEFSRRAVLTIAYLGVVGTSLAFTIYFWALRHMSVHVVGLTAYITPLIALLLGVWLRGEPLTATVVTCTAAILVGVFLARSAPRPAPAPANSR